jgi:hypothetical protein
MIVYLDVADAIALEFIHLPSSICHQIGSHRNASPNPDEPFLGAPFPSLGQQSALANGLTTMAQRASVIATAVRKDEYFNIEFLLVNSKQQWH